MPNFAIIDVETTGGQPHVDKIIEIAIIIHDGRNVIQQYETLINPERVIPSNISILTGISNDMVQSAPKFYEVAKTIIELTEDTIFVAHNVRFDYNFVREEYKRLGYVFTRKQLCTVRLSRQTFPGLPSYSLGNLIKHFHIQVNARHRAMADTFATSLIFEKIVLLNQELSDSAELISLGIKESKLPQNLTIEKISNLPEECGVYYFHNKDGNIIYVGKSKNIRKRIVEHFSDHTEKASKLQKLVFDISFELTGSELIALILEDTEIKRLKPDVNKSQRKYIYPYTIQYFLDQDGYMRFGVAKNSVANQKKYTMVGEFARLPDAKSKLIQIKYTYQLCAILCGIEYGNQACFDYKIGKCYGACCKNESFLDYNARTQEAIIALNRNLEGSFLIIDTGRSLDENSVVYVHNGKFMGYGYVDNAENFSTNEIIQQIKKSNSTIDIQRIIYRFLNENKKIKIYPINEIKE